MANIPEPALVASLSESEKEIFQQLLLRLTALNGKIADLTDTEKEQLAELSKKHQGDFTKVVSELDFSNKQHISADVSSVVNTAQISSVEDFKKTTEFGTYVLETINHSLCEGGAGTADAIRYAFHNKWMPTNLKNRDICEALFYRYYDDIEEVGQNIQQQVTSNSNVDAVVAVGLAWFTTLYQIYQRVEAEGDI